MANVGFPPIPPPQHTLSLKVAVDSLGGPEILIRSFVTALGGEFDSITLSDFLAIQVDDMETQLRTLEVDSTLISPALRGRLARHIQKLAEVGGFQPPALGTMLPAATIAPSGSGQAGPVDSSPPERERKQKMSKVMEQNDEDEFELMQDRKFRELRTAFEARNGGEVRENEDVTLDQISGLAARLVRDQAPFADFAIWGPYGKRQMKLLKYTAQVWVDGKLVSRQLTGPSSFEVWRSCWRVFRTGMLMLGASREGALDEYEEGIRMLAVAFPQYWGVIARADEIMRSEQWERIRCKIEQLVARGRFDDPWDKERPWEAVLRYSAHGSDDGRRSNDWWYNHVKQPCLQAPNCISAIHRQIALEGAAPVGELSTTEARVQSGGVQAARGVKQKRVERDEARKQQRAAANHDGRRADGRFIRNAEDVELCFSWNRSPKGCVDGKCPNERAHQCEWCLSPDHRAVDDRCHANKRPKGWTPKGQGKGSK